MTDYKRADRVADQLKAEISDILMRKIKDPRVGFVTITRIKLSDDLKNAVVYISVMGDETTVKDSLKGLSSATGFIRAEIGRRLELRVVPSVKFFIDESYEEGEKILDLLREIRPVGGYVDDTVDDAPEYPVENGTQTDGDDE